MSDFDRDTTPPPPPAEEVPPQPNSRGTNFIIWPPSQRTRDAIINRLIQTLTTPTSLSNRYGIFSSDEAVDVTRRIEEDALVAAGAVAAVVPIDGVEILQTYSQEISKRMLETAKARAEPASATGNGGGASDDGVVTGAASDSRLDLMC